MQLTININPSAAEKVLYLLESLKNDVTILEVETNLNITKVSENDPIHPYLVKASKARNPQDYGSLDDIK